MCNSRKARQGLVRALLAKQIGGRWADGLVASLSAGGGDPVCSCRPSIIWWSRILKHLRVKWVDDQARVYSLILDAVANGGIPALVNPRRLPLQQWKTLSISRHFICVCLVRPVFCVSSHRNCICISGAFKVRLLWDTPNSYSLQPFSSQCVSHLLFFNDRGQKFVLLTIRLVKTLK